MMSGREFKEFVRSLLNDLCEVSEERDREKQDAKIEAIISNLQKCLKD